MSLCFVNAADVSEAEAASGRAELPKNFDPTSSEERLYKWCAGAGAGEALRLAAA